MSQNLYRFLIVACIGLLIPFSAVLAQDEMVVHSDVINVDGATAEALFKIAESWARATYQTNEDFVQDADADKGRIKCKGSFSTRIFLVEVKIRHTLYLDFLDGKCRYAFTDYVYQGGSGGNSILEKAVLSFNKSRILRNTEKEADERAAELEAYIRDNQ